MALIFIESSVLSVNRTRSSAGSAAWRSVMRVAALAIGESTKAFSFGRRPARCRSPMMESRSCVRPTANDGITTLPFFEASVSFSAKANSSRVCARFL